jgi:hypothetical protein
MHTCSLWWLVGHLNLCSGLRQFLISVNNRLHLILSLRRQQHRLTFLLFFLLSVLFQQIDFLAARLDRPWVLFETHFNNIRNPQQLRSAIEISSSVSKVLVNCGDDRFGISY